MRYGLPTELGDGVHLKTGSTPLPEGAIEPVPNWEDIFNIPWYYLKVVGDQIVEKTDQEKADWDAANPPTIDEQKEIAEAYLVETDRSAIDSLETGTELPSDIGSERARSRIILSGGG
jgi:hypothetical protein